MSELKHIARRFAKDEEGAAMLEYTILIGIITVAAIAAIVLAGDWVSTQWTTLSGKLK